MRSWLLPRCRYVGNWYVIGSIAIAHPSLLADFVAHFNIPGALYFKSDICEERDYGRYLRFPCPAKQNECTRNIRDYVFACFSIPSTTDEQAALLPNLEVSALLNACAQPNFFLPSPCNDVAPPTDPTYWHIPTEVSDENELHLLSRKRTD